MAGVLCGRARKETRPSAPTHDSQHGGVAPGVAGVCRVYQRQRRGPVALVPWASGGRKNIPLVSLVTDKGAASVADSASSTVINHLASKAANGTAAVAYWYFDYAREKELDQQMFCATLLKQLAGSLPQLPLEVKDLHQRHSANIAKTRPHLSDGLSETLFSLLIQVEMPFIIIDALDECRGQYLMPILDIITNLQDHGARVFVTSRPSIDCPSSTASVWHKIEIHAHADDLRRLVAHKIKGRKNSTTMQRIMTPELREEIVEAVVAQAQGMFLWATLQLDEILKGWKKAQIIRALKSMPKSIYGVFDQTLHRIVDTDLAMPTLLWLAYAKEPLDFRAISHAVTMEVYYTEEEDEDDTFGADDIPHIEELVEACCGLVIMDGDKNLRLAHFSIQEYFSQNPDKFAPLTEEHVARACLAYLSLPVFRDGWLDSERKMQQRLQRYPLYSYAARKWHTHLPPSPASPEIERAAWKVYSHPGLFSSYSQVFYSQDYRVYTNRRLGGHDMFSFQEGFTPLHHAVELNLPGVVRRLLEHDLDPSSETHQKTTPLHLAVRDERKDLVEMLVSAGANRSACGLIPFPRLREVSTDDWEKFWHNQYGAFPPSSDRYYYPVEFAFIMGLGDITDILLNDAKLDLEVAGAILRTASTLPNHEIVRRVLTDYPELDYWCPAFVQAVKAICKNTGRSCVELEDNAIRIILQSRPPIGDQEGVLTAMLAAAVSAAPEFVANLLDKGANPNGDTDASPLQIAMLGGRDAAAMLLIEKGADFSNPQILASAVRSGMTHLVEFLLDHGSDPNGRDENSRDGFPVAIAAGRGHADTLALLLSRGGEVDGVNEYGLTALGDIAFDGDDNFEIAKILLDYGADPNADGFNGTPLMRAAIHAQQKFIALLIDRGANVNLVSEGRDGTILSVAATYGHEDLCRLLLRSGADPNLGKDVLPLMEALSYKFSIEIFELLLQNEADPLRRTSDGRYALEIAVGRGLQDAVRVLLEHGADIHMRGGRYGSIMHAAAASNDDAIIKMMLDLGAEVVEDDKYDGLLHRTERHHQLLINLGADVNALGHFGTPLQDVIQKFHDKNETLLQVFELLINSGADVNKSGGYFGCPLQAAARFGLEAIVNKLLELGARPETAGGRYSTALQAAARFGHETIVDKLLEHGASPGGDGGRYGSALQAAAYHGNEAVVSTLLEHGAEVNKTGGIYGTALQAAAFRGHQVIVRQLVESGADLTLRGGRYHNPLKAAREEKSIRNRVTAQILLEYGAVDDFVPPEHPAEKHWRGSRSGDESECDDDY